MRRASVRSGAGGDRLRTVRRGRPDERAASYPRARLAPGAGLQDISTRKRAMSELNRATILGTGTMGPGMGAVLARAGLQVTLFDVNPEALERARGMVGMVEGVLDRLEVPTRDGGGLAYETDRAAALDGTEVVVEAIPEQLELKRQVF